jgi:hypothetical protein
MASLIFSCSPFFFNLSSICLIIISEDKLSGNPIQIEMNIVNLYMMGGLLLVVIKWAMVELTTTSRLNIPHIVINTSNIRVLTVFSSSKFLVSALNSLSNNFFF